MVNHYKEDALKKIFLDYGEEPKSGRIADTLFKQRKIKKFTTTQELSDLIGTISQDIKTKIRIFQALRIEVNHELENLEKSLHDALGILETKGRIFVISFHSLEDRIVKDIFKKETKDCICRDILCTCHHHKTLNLITKKPIVPSIEEIKANKRSRSAKARCAEKI